MEREADGTFDEEDTTGMVYLSSRSPRGGSSRASQLSSLVHSHRLVIFCDFYVHWVEENCKIYLAWYMYDGIRNFV